MLRFALVALFVSATHSSPEGNVWSKLRSVPLDIIPQFEDIRPVATLTEEPNNVRPESIGPFKFMKSHPIVQLSPALAQNQHLVPPDELKDGFLGSLNQELRKPEFIFSSQENPHPGKFLTFDKGERKLITGDDYLIHGLDLEPNGSGFLSDNPLPSEFQFLRVPNGFYNGPIKYSQQNFPLSSSITENIRPPYRGPYSPDSFMQHLSTPHHNYYPLSPNNNAPKPYLNLLDTNGPNTDYLNTFHHQFTNNFLISKTDYNNIQETLNNIIDNDQLVSKTILRTPRLLLALNSLSHNLGNARFTWDEKRLNYLLDYVVQIYGTNASNILKEPYTWYLLCLLSNSQGLQSPEIDYRMIFKTLNELINTEGLHSEDILKNPYINYAITSLPRVLDYSGNGIDYRSLYTPLDEVLRINGLSVDSILENPRVWFVVNSLHRLRGHNGFLDKNTEIFSYYLKYLITTYGNQAGRLLREPYTWYLLSLLSRFPIDASLPEGVEYKTIFRTLNDLINDDRISAGGILQHPYIRNTVNALEHQPELYEYHHTAYPFDDDAFTNIFPSKVEYKKVCDQLEDIVTTQGLNAVSLVKEPQLWNIMNKMRHYAHDNPIPMTNNKTLRHFLMTIIINYGKGAEEILKKPYTWYLISLLMDNSQIGHLPAGTDYKAVFRKLNDLINIEHLQEDEIAKNPFVISVVFNLKQPREMFYKSGKVVYPNHNFYPRFGYYSKRKILKDVIKLNGLNIETVKEEPAIQNIINEISHSFGDEGNLNIDKESFSYYFNYIMKTYGKSAEHIFNEPYTWYIMGLLCQGPAQGLLSSDVDYRALFRTINDLINTDGKRGEDILFHPFISNTIETLRHSNRIVYPSQFFHDVGNTQVFEGLDYDTLHRTLTNIIKSSELNREEMQENPSIWEVIDTVQRAFGDSGKSYTNKASFNYYLDYILNTYGKSAEFMLEEPYTWYIISLLSNSPVKEGYLPSGVIYQKIFRIINDLVNTDGKHDREILMHPYISRSIQLLRHPREMSFPPVSQFPAQLSQTFNDIQITQDQYNNYHSILIDILTRCGLHPNEILHETNLQELINFFQAFDELSFSQNIPLASNEKLKYNLNYIINNFGNSAKNILEEPLTWYLIRLLSRGPVESYVPPLVDNTRIFNILNELINDKGKNYMEILNNPYIMNTINVLRHPYRNMFLPNLNSAPAYSQMNTFQEYPPFAEYDDYHNKLISVLKRCGLESETILKETDLWDILDNFQRYSDHFHFPDLNKESFKYYLNFIIKTYGRNAEFILKEPFTWYIMRIMSGGPVDNYLPVDVSYQKVFSTLNDLINNKNQHYMDIVNYPYMTQTLNTLRQPREIIYPESYNFAPHYPNKFPPNNKFTNMLTPIYNFPPGMPDSYFSQTQTFKYPTHDEYEGYHKKLIDVLERCGLKPDNILKENDLWYILNNFQQYNENYELPILDNDSFKYYLSFIINTYGKKAETMLKEPYTWYLMRLMSGGPAKTYLPFDVSYQKVFDTLDNLINSDGKHYQDILENSYISHVVTSLRKPKSFFSDEELFTPDDLKSPFLKPSFSPFPFGTLNNINKSPFNFQIYGQKLEEIIERCGLKPDIILKDPELWNTVRAIQQSRGGNDFFIDKQVYEQYLDFIIEHFGNNARAILKEPRTWYILSLLSQSQIKDELPAGIGYKNILANLNNFENSDGLYSDQSISTSPFSTLLYSTLPFSTFPHSSQQYPSYTVNNIDSTPIDYQTYHRKLDDIIQRCGLKPEIILKETDLWDIIRVIRHSRGDNEFPIMDNKAYIQYLKYIINNFGNNAGAILKEPYTWYILSLLSQSQINGELPAGIDYEHILTSLNNFINKDGLHGEDIIKQPSIWSIINSIHQSNGIGGNPSDMDYRPFHKLLDGLITTNGITDDKQLRDHYLWYIVNALKQSTGNGRFPAVDYKIFNNLLNYIVKAYGPNAQVVLKEPYTWYILSLMSDGSMSQITKNGELPPGIDYKTFYSLLNHLIKTHGLNAEGILKSPYIWYVMNTLKTGSTPVKYGKNVNEVEELVNSDGAQYLIYSTYNKTWVHPTLGHELYPGSEMDINLGTYGKVENKLTELLNTVIQGIPGAESHNLNLGVLGVNAGEIQNSNIYTKIGEESTVKTNVGIIPGSQQIIESHTITSQPGQVILGVNGGNAVSSESNLSGNTLQIHGSGNGGASSQIMIETNGQNAHKTSGSSIAIIPGSSEQVNIHGGNSLIIGNNVSGGNVQVHSGESGSGSIVVGQTVQQAPTASYSSISGSTSQIISGGSAVTPTVTYTTGTTGIKVPSYQLALNSGGGSGGGSSSRGSILGLGANAVSNTVGGFLGGLGKVITTGIGSSSSQSSSGGNLLINGQNGGSSSSTTLTLNGGNGGGGSTLVLGGNGGSSTISTIEGPTLTLGGGENMYNSNVLLPENSDGSSSSSSVITF